MTADDIVRGCARQLLEWYRFQTREGRTPDELAAMLTVGASEAIGDADVTITRRVDLLASLDEHPEDRATAAALRAWVSPAADVFPAVVEIDGATCIRPLSLARELAALGTTAALPFAKGSR